MTTADNFSMAEFSTVTQSTRADLETAIQALHSVPQCDWTFEKMPDMSAIAADKDDGIDVIMTRSGTNQQYDTMIGFEIEEMDDVFSPEDRDNPAYGLHKDIVSTHFANMPFSWKYTPQVMWLRRAAESFIVPEDRLSAYANDLFDSMPEPRVEYQEFNVIYRHMQGGGIVYKETRGNHRFIQNGGFLMAPLGTVIVLCEPDARGGRKYLYKSNRRTAILTEATPEIIAAEENVDGSLLDRLNSIKLTLNENSRRGLADLTEAKTRRFIHAIEAATIMLNNA